MVRGISPVGTTSGISWSLRVCWSMKVHVVVSMRNGCSPHVRADSSVASHTCGSWTLSNGPWHGRVCGGVGAGVRRHAAGDSGHVQHKLVDFGECRGNLGC